MCPYCDRQYITNYKENDKYKTTLDWDHFKPKSIYPYLSLSLYNLIPSCPICNQRMKKVKSESIIYPFDEGFGSDCIFVLTSNKTKKDNDYYISKVNSILEIEPNEKLELVINTKCNSKRRKRIENSIKTFKLEEVYQVHDEFAQEIRNKRIISNNENYVQALNDVMKDEKISFATSDLMIYGYNWDKDGIDRNKTLSKLAYDIAKR